ncbi:hypothetical protein FRC07_003366, partial [Ceratobasidium sp. 392]
MTVPRQEQSDDVRPDEIASCIEIEIPPNSPPINNLEDEEASKAEPEKPYSIYTKREKWYMVAMAALAGLFSALSVALYFPAIPTLAVAFEKSTESINLTVTMYMILQGISPLFWGVVADRLGRRPVYLMCLTLLLVSCIGLALVPTNAYWLLMLLRCVQAAGSASTIALGARVISDIATSAERGGFLGLFTLGPMIGPCIGPVVGGLLSGSLGWRSMFWFLAIATGLVLVFMGLTFPETLRAITGDGSLPPQKWNRTPLPILGRKSVQNASSSQQDPRPRSPRPLQILRAFTQPDVLIILICTGILYSMLYSVPATTATLLQSAHPYLTEITTGLCFIPLGVGGSLGSAGIGKVLDYDWRKMEARYNLLEPGSPSLEQKDTRQLEEGDRSAHITRSDEAPQLVKKDKQELPIVHTRLKRVPIIFALEIGTCIGYGWSVQKKAPLAVPLVLQFFIGLVWMPMMTIHQTILVDMYPSQASSIIAA